MKYKILVLAFLVIFAITGINIVSANAVSQGKGTSLVAVASKKKVVKKKKKVVKKAVKKTPTKKTPTAKSSTSSGLTFHNADYTGPFPAPEGIVLNGTYGEDKFKEPTGKGQYRFKIQTAWDKDVSCLDKTRTLVGSKGKTWEEGYSKGFNIGVAAKESLIVIYNDIPQGVKAGNSFYDEGYKLGYDIGFGNAKAPPYVYGCDVGEGFDINAYDEDGWEKQPLDKLPGLKALYIPAEGAGLSDKDSGLGKDAIAFSLGTINTGLNAGKPDFNISQMDFKESKLDADEADLPMSEFAQAIYKGHKNGIESKVALKSTCVVMEPGIEEATYGNNAFTNIGWITTCLDAGNENKWAYSMYSFMKMPGDKILMISISVPGSVKTKGADSTDEKKLPSTDFIEQLYSKIQVKK